MAASVTISFLIFLLSQYALFCVSTFFADCTLVDVHFKPFVLSQQP